MMDVYYIYTKLPDALQAWISKIIYKPSIGRHVQLRGKCHFHWKVVIGDYTVINTNAYLANVEIGKYCSIGKGFQTIVMSHRINLFTIKAIGDLFEEKHIKDVLDEPYKPYIIGNVVIGNDVWIGENVTVISSGGGTVTIGDGAVVGAGSIVTKDIPPYAICAGVPAKIIRYRFESDKVKELMNEKWWNWDECQISERYWSEYKNQQEV